MSLSPRRAWWSRAANRERTDLLPPAVPEAPMEPPAAADAPAAEPLPAGWIPDYSTRELPAEGRGGAPAAAGAAANAEIHAPEEVQRQPAAAPAETPTRVGRRLAAATSVVGAAFVVSRVLGLVREQIIAAQLDVGDRLDVYVASFRIPDTLFLLVIGGVVGSAFIPVFGGLMERGRIAEAWRLATTLINASVVVLALLGIAMALLAPALVSAVIAPAFEPAMQRQVVDLTRLMLLSPLFLGLGGWAQGILNARQHFALPALAPIAYNLSIILGALFLVPSYGVLGLGYGVVAGGLLHFLVQVPGLVRAGMRYSPLRIDIRDEGALEVGRLMLPRIGGQAAFQVNIIAATNFLSFYGAGPLGAFNLAYLLMILPHGVFAMSMATVLFPTMSAQVARGDLPGMKSTLMGGLRVLFFLSAPAAVLLGLLRTEIVAVLFQFGNFRAEAVDLVAAALGWFAWGLVAYALVEVLTRAFYALHDTATPLVVSVATVGLNIALSWFLVFQARLDFTALALSLALTTTVEMVLLLLFLRGKTGPLFEARTLRSAATTLLATTVMAGVLLVVTPFFATYIWAHPDDTAGTKVVYILRLALEAACGGAAFLLAARLLRAEELRSALGMIRRRGA